MSLPNQYSADGGLMRRTGATACGSMVPSHGAKIATNIMSNSTTPPTIAVGCRRNDARKRRHVGDSDFGSASIATVFMSVPNPRVEEHIAQVHGQVHEHVRAREQQD